METKTNDVAVQQQLLKVSSSPHVRTQDSTKQIMRDVIIALIPAGIASIAFFGARSLAVILVSVLSAVLAEYVTEKAMKKPITTSDLSAVVTGILLAYNVPPTLPLWKVAAGAAFAIVIVKQFFGGIGSNFINPALAGRAFLMSSWGAEMTKTVLPFQPDTLSGPTPLTTGEFPPLIDMFLGKEPGMLGEVSALCLLIGAAYLLIRKVIRIRIPAYYLASFVVFTLIFGAINGQVGFQDIPAQLFSGGLMLGAFFMATDYVTCPVTEKGQMIFALGCGLLTALIRQFGGYPEGVSYSILIMNVLTPLLDRNIVRDPFGTETAKKMAEAAKTSEEVK